MKKANLLSRAEMRRVVGGVVEVPGGCSAKCHGKSPDNEVSCTGTVCTAVDYDYCIGTGPGTAEDKKYCKKTAEE